MLHCLFQIVYFFHCFKQTVYDIPNCKQLLSLTFFALIYSLSFVIFPLGEKVWLCVCTPSSPLSALAYENAVKLYYTPSYAVPDSVIASYAEIELLI